MNRIILIIQYSFKAMLNIYSSWVGRNCTYLLTQVKQLIEFRKLNGQQLQLIVQTTDNALSENNFSIPISKRLLDNHQKYPDPGKRGDNDRLKMPVLINSGKHLTIVIVADNIYFREFLSDYLSLWYNCLEACDVENGYDLVVKYNPDIVISEIQLSKMEGFQLCEKIKSNSNTSSIPIILLTPQNTPEYMVEGYEKGADACIAKPFKMSIIKAQILQLIKNRELIRDKYINQYFWIESPALRLSRNQEFIIQLQRLLEENISDFDFSVQELSSRLNISNTSLYRKTKLLTGFSPVEFMLHFKMQKACKYLSTSESIKAIGYGLGFRNLSYFSKCFKKQFGVTPFVFRQKGFQTELNDMVQYSFQTHKTMVG